MNEKKKKVKNELSKSLRFRASFNRYFVLLKDYSGVLQVYVGDNYPEECSSWGSHSAELML